MYLDITHCHEPVAHAMGRDSRFKTLKRCLHFVDNHSATPRIVQDLAKIDCLK